MKILDEYGQNEFMFYKTLKEHIELHKKGELKQSEWYAMSNEKDNTKPTLWMPHNEFIAYVKLQEIFDNNLKNELWK